MGALFICAVAEGTLPTVTTIARKGSGMFMPFRAMVVTVGSCILANSPKEKEHPRSGLRELCLSGVSEKSATYLIRPNTAELCHKSVCEAYSRRERPSNLP